MNQSFIQPVFQRGVENFMRLAVVQGKVGSCSCLGVESSAFQCRTAT